jgi:glyoxylate/hydroxypyruvate reductase A
MTLPVAYLCPLGGYNHWRKALARHDTNITLLSEDDARKQADAIRYALVWRPAAGSVAAFPNLKACLSLGAGVDAVIGDDTYPRHVPLIRLVDPDMTQRMVEYVAQHTLMHHRRHLDHAAQQADRKWKEIWTPVAQKRRVGVMGIGALGMACARALAALGFDVAGWSRTAKPEAGIEVFHGGDGLAPFLNRSEILVTLLPLTDDTRGLLNREMLSHLPEGASVINAGRGALIVDEDLLALLDEGHIAGASLDVFSKEPLPEDHPYWTHPHVIVTPHDSALTDADAVARTLVETMHALERGEAPQNTVDFERGY